MHCFFTSAPFRAHTSTKPSPARFASHARRVFCSSQRRLEQLTSTETSKQYRVAARRVLRQLSSLELAISELTALAGLSAVGTVIKQNEPVEYYVQNYPEGGGLFDFHAIWALQWDHIYTADYFLALLGLLAASLAACSTTRQWPMVKVARRWRLAGSPQRVAASGSAENAVTLPDANLHDLGRLLRQKGYAVFLQQGSLYAFKGLAGKLAPIGVHLSLLAIIAGVAIGGLGGLSGSVLVPEDGDFIFSEALRPKSALGRPGAALQRSRLHVDRFDIKYRADGSVGQYESDVSISDVATDQQLVRKTVSVNNPLRFNGLTAYQTDWSIAAVTLQVRSSATDSTAMEAQPLNLPVASMEGQPGISGKLWATFLPAEGPAEPGRKPRGVSLLMRDLQTVALYDTHGAFVGVRRPGSGKSIAVEGLEIVVDNVVGSTGLELKVDPGVPYVYAGFAGLMVTTALSYLSHSQVWALQQDRSLHVSGKSNRAIVSFEEEFAALIERVPERTC